MVLRESCVRSFWRHVAGLAACPLTNAHPSSLTLRYTRISQERVILWKAEHILISQELSPSEFSVPRFRIQVCEGGARSQDTQTQPGQCGLELQPYCPSKHSAPGTATRTKSSPFPTLVISVGDGKILWTPSKSFPPLPPSPTRFRVVIQKTHTGVAVLFIKILKSFVC